MVRRVIGLFSRPRQEWTRIKEESVPAFRLFFSFALAVAAVPPVFRFLAGLVYGHYRRPYSGWSWTIAGRELLFSAALYILSLMIVYLWAWAISIFGPVFSSRFPRGDSLKLAVVSMSPYWLAGVFYFVPDFGWALKVMTGIYGFYLLYLGFAVHFLETSRGKRLGYFVVSSLFGLILVAYVEVFLRLLFAFWGVLKIS